ncbi:MAG: phosphoglycerate dehydrogenase [Candidatus Omnitrophica bacterium]|nr:phosphoglycerate dehydrogenase [Candidatus Omnitrophota bacterium]
MTDVLIATSTFGALDPQPLERLRRAGMTVRTNTLGRSLRPEELIAQAQGCAGIIAGIERYDQTVLEHLPQLRVISRVGAGVDGIDHEAARARGIVVASTPDAVSPAVAELTVGLLLDLIRAISASDAQVRRGRWEKRMGRLASELTVGLIGLGRIGRRVAALLGEFGARVIGCDVRPDPAWAKEHGVALRERDALLAESDVVTLHVPYEPLLHHAIGARELGLMKRGSFLINTSRGGLVDETALAQALASGHLAGAALDVFEQEPYEGPLCGMDQVILTPHIGSYARQARIEMERQAVEHLLVALNSVQLTK